MRSLSAKVLGKLHFNLEQVQDLTPTPMTLSSVMFYTGRTPIHMKKSTLPVRRRRNGGRRVISSMKSPHQKHFKSTGAETNIYLTNNILPVNTSFSKPVPDYFYVRRSYQIPAVWD